MINFKQILSDYGINISEKGQHSREGWTQIQCPFCLKTSTSKKKYHGGFNEKDEYYNCWKCKWHPLDETLSLLLSCTLKEAKIILRKYKTGEVISLKEEKEIIKKPFHLPDFCGKMNPQHKLYLEKRNFDPDKIEKEWGLLGTNHHGDYRLRIIAPIFLDKKIVSYQGRDITNKSTIRYMACKIEEEITHHKDILYGIDKLEETKHKNQCIIVEGITDAWRLGSGAIATFGIAFTQKQVLFLAKRGIKLAYIMYDPEEQAQEQAEKLSYQLLGFGVDTKIVDISEENAEDPGTLSDLRAKEISRELLG